MSRIDPRGFPDGLSSALPAQQWPAAQLAEARAVIADVAHHSDHLIRLACNVLTAHGETEEERRDARALLFVIDARRSVRQRHLETPAPEVQR